MSRSGRLLPRALYEVVGIALKAKPTSEQTADVANHAHKGCLRSFAIATTCSGKASLREVDQRMTIKVVHAAKLTRRAQSADALLSE
jgi:hypothetical protein